MGMAPSSTFGHSSSPATASETNRRFAAKMASRFGARQSILTTQLSCDWNSSTNNQLSASDLTLSADFIFEGRQLFGPDGPPRVKLARGDSDLRAKAELAAIGELGRGVPDDDGAIHLIEESLGDRKSVV